MEEDEQLVDKLTLDDEDVDSSKEGNEEENEYIVDEVALKDRDVDLTEEQKEEFKKQANELKNRGNDQFRESDFTGATTTYTQALQICPLVFTKERAVLFANRAAARTKFMNNKDPAVEDCTKAIELDSDYVKAYLRRAHLYEELDKLDEAIADFKKVLTFDPVHTESICAVKRLEPIISERNEKLKEEMLGKLKDLGNVILKPFGLSTNNFQMEKDETTGGYSVKFNQNPT
ncbi:hypothetical protein QAD02_019293 [Eretmocerus hayati]|uniref:Uncharacterized protein n=1 Tax=Eretmocerus hayati TaxID=131215 RepID=A0ACC2PL05_9HYME|nr:hypothetical protein QAD02_019293 [Eretmocerus hayati]